MTFCPGGRKPNEPIPLKERGQGLVAVVFALEKQDNEEGNPNSIQSQADTQQSQRPYSGEPSEHLIVEDIANLNSHVLRDLLSDEPITAPKPSQPMPPPIMCSEPRIIQESDLFF